MKTFSQKLLSTCLSIYEKNKKNKLLLSILLFCSVIFEFLYRFRLDLYKRKILQRNTLQAYIISIGNITSGGTGKTPLTIEIAKHFINKNYKVAILCRGYNSPSSNTNGVILVSDGSDILLDYDQCGDEPYLIAKKAPKALVFVGKNRVKLAKSAIKLGAQVLILDDGFQYLKLDRNENILMMDSYKPFDNGYLIPRGKLREKSDSINRSTAIILSNSDRVKINENDLSTIKQYANNRPILTIGYRIKEFTGLNMKRVLEVNKTKDLKVLAVCGIGNPESFIELLKMQGINVISSLIYPDHYNYEYKDIQEMIKEASKQNIEDIITTEKDGVKLEEICQAAPLNFWNTKLEVITTPNFYENLFINIKQLK